MSQKKVDEYKKYKANRKQVWKKEKRMKRLEIAVFLAVIIGLIGWFGGSVYRQIKADQSAKGEIASIQLDVDAMTEYQQALANSMQAK
jgi:hypothetical protein